MSLRTALIVVLLAPATTQACQVVLGNASGVDLWLQAEAGKVLLGPGEHRRVPLSALAAIDFGAESRTFAPASAASVLCPPTREIELEARPDGKLWLRSREQPEGLPLAPVEIHDLTWSPPNNSSTPTPSRGSA